MRSSSTHHDEVKVVYFEGGRTDETLHLESARGGRKKRRPSYLTYVVSLDPDSDDNPRPVVTKSGTGRVGLVASRTGRF